MFLYKDYTITIYLNQYWTDERLSFSDNDEENMTLTGDFTDKIWVPDTFFANDKLSFLHAVTEKNHMIRLYGDGSVVYGMRLVLSRFFVFHCFRSSFILSMSQWHVCVGQTISDDRALVYSVHSEQLHLYVGSRAVVKKLVTPLYFDLAPPT